MAATAERPTDRQRQVGDGRTDGQTDRRGRTKEGDDDERRRINDFGLVLMSRRGNRGESAVRWLRAAAAAEAERSVDGHAWTAERRESGTLIACRMILLFLWNHDPSRKILPALR